MLLRTLRKILYLFRHGIHERNLAEEIETHRTMLNQDLARHPAASYENSLRRMGNLTLAREQSRDLWSFTYLDSIFKDLRHALRSLRRTPVFTAVAVTSLALGIGANTAIFSFVNAILLKTLPVPEPSRLVRISENKSGKITGMVARMTTVDELAKRGSSFSGLFGWFPKQMSFSRGTSSEWLIGELVTGQYFQTLEVKPALGNLLNDDDVRRATAYPVCVISYDFWQREFAGDPSVLTQTITLNGHSYKIVGVTERGFLGAALQAKASLQVPATRIGDFMPAFNSDTGVNWLKTLSWLSPMARLKPGITIQQAQARTQQLFQEMERNSSENRTSEKRKLSLQDGAQGFNNLSSFAEPALVLMGVAGLVLLAACANLANLLLARAQSRTQEFAVRLSIGASRMRLVRQLFVESFLLSLLGGAAGILVSLWVSRSLETFLNTGENVRSAFHQQLDLNVLAFAVVLSLTTALLFGLIPAWHASKPDILPGLKQEFFSSGRTSGVFLRRALVVVQIVLSVVVVFSAGLLARTLRTLQTVDLGFQPDRVIALNVDPAASGYGDAQISHLLNQIMERARVLPAVQAASLAFSTPHGALGISMSIGVDGYTPKGPGDDVVKFNFVSPQYFATIGQPLLRGRDFLGADDLGKARVAILNERTARKYWPGQDPIGRKFRQRGGDVEIVGLVRDARDNGLREGPVETVYMPERQGQTSGLTILVRTSTDPREVVSSLLAIVRSIDRHMPVYSVHTLDTEIGAGLSSERILGYLSTIFAVLATLLAGIGLYGVLAYSVVRRTREMGIRLALGAQRQEIGILFARESFLLVLVGVIIGGPVALASVRILKSLLFGVTMNDPFTLLFSILALGFSALLASTVPLWRATRINPVIALRYD